MAIQKRTTTWYRVRCDGCGAVAPESLAQEESLSLAEEEGWQHFSRWNGLEYIQRDFCPACFKKWEAEQEAKLQDWQEALAEELSQEPAEAS